MAVRLISFSPMKTRRLSPSSFKSPAVMIRDAERAGFAAFLEFLRMMALILAFTSRILNGFVM